MSRLNKRRGANVSKGDIIGYVGSTGYSTGAHLHFEIRENGVQIDPLTFDYNYDNPRESNKRT